MKKNILLVELCNYQDHPLGGQLSFAMHALKAFGNELALVGVATDEHTPIGKWTRKVIDGSEYDFYAVKRIYPSSRKSIIPKRIIAYLASRKHRKNIVAYGCKNVIIQAPEVFFSFKKFKHLNICLVMPGLGNPLRFSRYSYGKFFAKIYENAFFRAINKASVLLAAADNNSMADFIERGNNKFDFNKLKQFPTRFDDTIFYPRNKQHSKNKLEIAEGITLIVTSGRLSFFKGWKFMIDAFELFKKEKNNTIFVFLGEGEGKAKIAQYLADNELKDCVQLRGQVDHQTLSEYLNAADLFIMGSFAEGWSTSLVEAVACGTPICTTNFSSAMELVQNRINGFVVEERNELLFAQKMNEAISLPPCGMAQKAFEIKKLAVANLKNDLLSKWETI